MLARTPLTRSTWERRERAICAVSVARAGSGDRWSRVSVDEFGDRQTPVVADVPVERRRRGALPLGVSGTVSREGVFAGSRRWIDPVHGRARWHRLASIGNGGTTSASSARSSGHRSVRRRRSCQWRTGCAPPRRARPESPRLAIRRPLLRRRRRLPARRVRSATRSRLPMAPMARCDPGDDASGPHRAASAVDGPRLRAPPGRVSPGVAAGHGTALASTRRPFRVVTVQSVDRRRSCAPDCDAVFARPVSRTSGPRARSRTFRWHADRGGLPSRRHRDVSPSGHRDARPKRQSSPTASDAEAKARHPAHRCTRSRHRRRHRLDGTAASARSLDSVTASVADLTDRGCTPGTGAVSCADRVRPCTTRCPTATAPI